MKRKHLTSHLDELKIICNQITVTNEAMNVKTVMRKAIDVCHVSKGIHIHHIKYKIYIYIV